MIILLKFFLNCKFENIIYLIYILVSYWKVSILVFLGIKLKSDDDFLNLIVQYFWVNLFKKKAEIA